LFSCLDLTAAAIIQLEHVLNVLEQGGRFARDHEDTGRALVRSLNVSQRAQAITDDTVRRDIVTGNQYPIDGSRYAPLPPCAGPVISN